LVRWSFPYNSPEYESDLVVCEKLSYTQPRKPISPASETMISGNMLMLVGRDLVEEARLSLRDRNLYYLDPVIS